MAIKIFASDTTVVTVGGLRSKSRIRMGADDEPNRAIASALQELTWIAKMAGMDPVAIVKERAEMIGPNLA